MHRERVEGVLRSLQIYVLRADGGDGIRLDARVRPLRNGTFRRGQRYILARLNCRILRLRQIAAIFDGDRPGHVPVEGDGQRVGIVLDADVPGNAWLLARFGFDAVHGDGIELVTRIFQNQGFPTLYHDVIGNDFARVALGDFPFALNGKIMLDIDIPEDQRSVLDILSQAAHALDMGGSRRDVHVGAVIQDADSVTRIAHDAGFRICLELQLLSCIDVGIGNIRVCVAHLEALFTIQGNSIPSKHGSQTEIIIIFHIPNKHVFIGTGLYQITAQGNVQRLCRSSDALHTADENQVVARDIGLVAIKCVVDSFFGK